MSLFDISTDEIFSGLEGLAFRGKWEEGVKKEVWYTCGLDKMEERREVTNDNYRRLQLIENIYSTMRSRDYIDLERLALLFTAEYLKRYPASRENMTPQLLLRIKARERREQEGRSREQDVSIQKSNIYILG